ncbi:MAG: hypothetical protein Q9167_005771 [Letrouitia subvulpina]
MTSVEFIRGKYVEDESFLCLGYPEPHVRHQELILNSQQFKWNIKVVFRSEAIQQQFEKASSHDTCIFIREPINNKLERRREFQSFIRCFDFHNLPLIHNTTTEINLLLKSQLETPVYNPDELHLAKDIPTGVQNRFIVVANKLKVTIQEDPHRIIYPVYAKDSTFSDTPEENIYTEEDLNGSILRVKRVGDSQSYIYKRVDRPFYEPSDTWVFLKELQNLKLLYGKSYIAQLRYIVFSSDPYQSSCTDSGPLVTRGFLLDYYPYGTLENRLQKADLEEFPWKYWPLQIGNGLLHLHQHKLTHMDLKPSNIVIDIYRNAVLIDISGVGGITPEWTAPELRDKQLPDIPYRQRTQNDVWAYGRIMCVLAESRDWADEVGFLRVVAAETTKDDPKMRIGLVDALSLLQDSGER